MPCSAGCDPTVLASPESRFGTVHYQLSRGVTAPPNRGPQQDTVNWHCSFLLLHGGHDLRRRLLLLGDGSHAATDELADAALGVVRAVAEVGLELFTQSQRLPVKVPLRQTIKTDRHNHVTLATAVISRG